MTHQFGEDKPVFFNGCLKEYTYNVIYLLKVDNVKFAKFRPCSSRISHRQLD